TARTAARRRSIVCRGARHEDQFKFHASDRARDHRRRAGRSALATNARRRLGACPRSAGSKNALASDHPPGGDAAPVRNTGPPSAQAERCHANAPTRNLKMDMSKYAGSAFITLDHVKDGPIRGVIDAIEEGQYGRPVITFTTGLRFSLNVTNTQTLIKACGS